jgi:ethanolamine ammonia-lyase small subunit
MDQAQINTLVEAIVAEINLQGRVIVAPARTGSPGREPNIDLTDLTTPEMRKRAWVQNPLNPEALRVSMATTPARIGIGRAGARYRNVPQLIFWADHAVTQDALFKEVDPNLLRQLNLFQVQTKVKDRQEYLLRPDLGRHLSDEARAVLQEKCAKQPDVQVYVADGLSAAAIEHNLRDIFPVVQQGLQQAGLKMGTPFYVRYGRVGLMNDVNSVVDSKVVVTLIGERPGLGRADSMSAYLGYRPRPDSSDADRDVVCNIYDGGTNPLEGGAYVVELIKKMIQNQASGVKLKLKGAE